MSKIPDLISDDPTSPVGHLAQEIRQRPSLLSDIVSHGDDITDAVFAFPSATARDLYQIRRRRDEMFGRELFGEPAWDMMLDLFTARGRGERISVSSLCVAASVPATTALRWISLLTERGIVVRDDDPADRRRVFIDLTPEAFVRMKVFLSGI
ncbi:winged helix DNA-binding protein [Sphingobium subterraneum]|uniref:HTH marR-type domain-containing protein n=1 Tax=Sphingobium subterraneum TaxID=627688 RepID=A0A841IUS5_9SPHN|nr:winged helix DNA-binding protein [Sphingobium subterraneum]MBB6122437.1 hypothetical protein [Sphingobium subterraneum]